MKQEYELQCNARILIYIYADTDQPPDQFFIIFLDELRLLPEKYENFCDPHPQLIPIGIRLRLLFINMKIL